jgi:outer membrane protein TolC
VVLQLRRARERIDAQGKTVEQAQRGYSIATARYRSGAGTQLEVNDAQLALTQARVNRIQAVNDYLSASADLDQLLGRIPHAPDAEVP